RDDSVIVRKRMFNQKPYKVYTYGGKASDLLEFVPETKNSITPSTAMDYMGYDKETKTYHQGTVDTTTKPGGVVLSTVLELSNTIGDIQKTAPNVSANTMVPSVTRILGSRNQSVLFGDGAISDNTRNVFLFKGVASLDQI